MDLSLKVSALNSRGLWDGPRPLLHLLLSLLNMAAGDGAVLKGGGQRWVPRDLESMPLAS